jgi:hypothetical protein
MQFKKHSKFKFIFIISRGLSTVFDVTVFADNEQQATKKLKNLIEDDFAYKIRNVEEQE